MTTHQGFHAADVHYKVNINHHSFSKDPCEEDRSVLILQTRKRTMRGEGISLRLHTSEVCLSACSKALLDSKGLSSSHPAFCLIQRMSVKYKLGKPVTHCLMLPVTCGFSPSPRFQATPHLGQ